MKKSLKILLFSSIILVLAIFCYFFIGQAPEQEKITWGVSFSQKHSQSLNLDWKETYLALLDDLKIKDLRLITHWDLIEPEKDKYVFDDLNWQLREAEKREVNVILVIGMKTPRWPECHIPDWVEGLNREEREKEILGLLKEIVLNYRGSTSIVEWQVENEPFFEFGECPEIREEFVKEEIELVKAIDFNNKEIIITESGTGSFWFKGAELGDIVGISLYRKVWFHKPKVYFRRNQGSAERSEAGSYFRRNQGSAERSEGGSYVNYPSPPIFYWRKAQIIEKLFDKEVICAELQAEPWGPVLLYDLSFEEQKKTMNLEQFKKNINFAQKTGLKEFYLWGGEWWFWLKTQQNQPEIWLEAKKLF